MCHNNLLWHLRLENFNLAFVSILTNSLKEGIFCKSSYQIYKPIEICNFVLWYHEGNNSANVYYDLAYPNKKWISLSWKTGETQNMEFLRRPLENVQEIHLTWSWWILPTAEWFLHPKLQVCNLITYTVCVSITSWKVFMTLLLGWCGWLYAMHGTYCFKLAS